MVSGDVQFPDYIMDVHGDMIAGSLTDDSGDFEDTPERIGRSVAEMLNTAQNTNPYSSFTLSGPSGPFNKVETQRDAYLAAVTGYGDENMADYVTNALLAVSGVSTSDIPNIPDITLSSVTTTDAQTLFSAHVDTMISKIPAVINAATSTALSESKIESLLASASSAAQAQASFAVATTSWISMISAITSTIKECQLPREVNLQSVLVKAAQDADSGLKQALKITKKYIDGDLLGELTTQFAQRRRADFNSRLSEYAGQMADLNAVNSSAFMFGMALLHNEENRSVADFDSQITLGMLREGLTAYVSIHNNSVAQGRLAEEANARHHTAIVNASLDLMATLQSEGEIKPNNLLDAYTRLFQGAIGNNAGIVDVLMRHMGFMRRDNLADTTRRHVTDAQFQFEADRLNKNADERRYLNGLSAVVSMVGNEVQLRKAFAEYELEYRDRRNDAIQTHEQRTQEYDAQEALWELNTMAQAAGILAGPLGGSQVIQGKPGIGREILSLGLQTAGLLLPRAVDAIFGGGDSLPPGTGVPQGYPSGGNFAGGLGSPGVGFGLPNSNPGNGVISLG